MKTPQSRPPLQPETNRPSRRRWPRRLAMFGLLLLLAVAAILGAPWLFPSPEDADKQHIAQERATRRLGAAMGLSLPGTPDLAKLKERLAAANVQEGAPVLIRIFKREFELELWMAREGRFQRFATYPICVWSGDLGPKLKTGDGQAPEGFYTVARDALNPNSRWHLSFNLGFPNAYDRSHGRTGSFLMVHGGCASVGCYAMTNGQIEEIWKLITAAFDKGQSHIQVQAYPFRMTPERLAAYQTHPSHAFWGDLAKGNAIFESTHLAPRVSVCNRRYVFGPGGTPQQGGPIQESCPQASVGK